MWIWDCKTASDAADNSSLGTSCSYIVCVASLQGFEWPGIVYWRICYYQRTHHRSHRVSSTHPLYIIIICRPLTSPQIPSDWSVPSAVYAGIVHSSF